VAEATDAARDRVLAARAALGEELEVLEASVRAAVDVPAKIRRSPAKAAAVVGSVGFVALRGPQRLFRAGKRAVRGAPPPLPPSLLPDEIEKTLRKLGKDGDKIRGTLERDFAAYAKEKSSRQAVGALVVASVARPLLARVTKGAAEWLFRTDDEGFKARLAEIRERAARSGASANQPSDKRTSRTTKVLGDAAADDAAGSAGA
jgi:hypothetical protein